MRHDSAEIPFRSFLQEAIVSSSGMDKNAQPFNVVQLAFPLLTTTSSTPPRCPVKWFWRGCRGVTALRSIVMFCSCNLFLLIWVVRWLHYRNCRVILFVCLFVANNASTLPTKYHIHALNESLWIIFFFFFFFPLYLPRQTVSAKKKTENVDNRTIWIDTWRGRQLCR